MVFNRLNMSWRGTGLRDLRKREKNVQENEVTARIHRAWQQDKRVGVIVNTYVCLLNYIGQ